MNRNPREVILTIGRTRAISDNGSPVHRRIKVPAATGKLWIGWHQILSRGTQEKLGASGHQDGEATTDTGLGSSARYT